MTWDVVARRDLREFRADRTLLYFGALFALLGGGLAFFATNGSTTQPFSDILPPVLLFAVPLTAVTLSHSAVPERAASGRLRLTLSLPHSRAAYVAGAGAASVAATVLLTALAAAVGVLVFLLRGGPIELLRLLGLLAASSLLAAAFVAGTLAFTAGSRSPTLSTATAYGFYLLSFIWPAVVAIATVVLASEFGVTLPEGLAPHLVHCSPLFAFQAAVSLLDASAPSGGGVSPWFGVLVLAAWVVLGYALAVRKFDRLAL